MAGTKELMPRPPVIRQRLAENLREREILRALLRASEKAALSGNPGGLMPEKVAEIKPENTVING